MRAILHFSARLLVVLCLAAPICVLAQSAVVVVAHPDTPALNEDALQKIYLGKIIEINGRVIVPVNLTKGNAIRNTFMELVMVQDDEKYVAYWTVRRYIGKGIPPREFASVDEQMNYVLSTPGAIAYVSEGATIKPGLKTLFKKP